MDTNWTISGILGFICIVGLVVLGMWGCPQYSVYSKRKEGEAELAHATYQREVAVAEAKAKMESAALLAVADTLRAVGVARSNIIIGKSLTTQYINWLWVKNMEEQDKSVIYVPAGNLGLPTQLPITEAGRLQPQIASPKDEEK